MEKLPDAEHPLPREIYITPEILAIAALVDAIDRRVLERKEEKDD